MSNHRLIRCVARLVTAAAALAAPLSAATDPPGAGPRRVRVQAIQVSDDDGGRACDITPQQVGVWLDYASRVFAPAGISFDFDGKADWRALRSTLLNNMSGDADSAWEQEVLLANRIAAEHAGKLVIFFRFGPGASPTGGGFSSHEYNFVAAPGFDHTSVCGRQNIHLLAHEIGHYLGLPHTFARTFQREDEARAFFRESAHALSVFDGDGFDDTPPDPFISELQCEPRSQLRWDQHTIRLPRNNLMGYWHGAAQTKLTPRQAERARWILDDRLRGGMATPVNQPGAQAIQFETLTPVRAENVHAGVQEMRQFSRFGWKDSQQFCVAQRGGSLSFRLAAAKPGRYTLVLFATRAPDYGVVRVKLDGQALGDMIDTYAPLVLPSGPIVLAAQEFDGGEHELTFEAAARSSDATGFNFGLDCLELRPVGGGE